MTAKKPLCPQCKDNAGFICDDETGLPIRRCSCREEPSSPKRERDAALAAVEAANPGQSKAAYEIVKDAARSMPLFSADETRAQMVLAGIDNRKVIGAAFRRCASEHLIRKAGKRPSGDRGTHSHEINEWESLIYRPAVSA